MDATEKLFSAMAACEKCERTSTAVRPQRRHPARVEPRVHRAWQYHDKVDLARRWMRTSS
jgi:hypothetical protein